MTRTLIRAGWIALSVFAAPVLPAAAGIHVIDGDTIAIGREHIRLVGIDAPETRQARCDGELRLGLEAKARLHELLTQACGPLPTADAGRCVVIRRQRDKDRYGRTLARVLIDGRDVGATLIAEGLARPYLCLAGRCPARQPWCGSAAP